MINAYTYLLMGNISKENPEQLLKQQIPLLLTKCYWTYLILEAWFCYVLLQGIVQISVNHEYIPLKVKSAIHSKWMTQEVLCASSHVIFKAIDIFLKLIVTYPGLYKDTFVKVWNVSEHIVPLLLPLHTY